jgi:hypothetical protein
MKRSTKIILGVVGSFIALLVVFSVIVQIYFAPIVRSLIETKGSAALGTPLTLDSVSISLFPPLTVHAKNIHFHMKSPDVEATLPEVSFQSRLTFSSDVNKILKSMSPLHFKIKNGTLNVHQADASIQLQSLDLASSFQISENPLRIKGQISLDIPDVIYESTSLPASGSSSSAKPQTEPKQAAALPDNSTARTAQIDIKLKIQNINYNSLKIKDVDFNGSLDNGWLKAHASIKQVLGGTVKVSDLAVNLTQPGNPTQLSVDAEGLDINEALTWKSPSWKDMVKGHLSADARFSSRGPQAQGSAHLSEVYISTLQIDQLINQKLAQIPGLKGKELVKSKGFAADIRSDYEYKNSVLNLKNLVFSTPEKNEVKAQGTIDTNKNADLSGTAYLATAPVGGSIRQANSDAEGRFVIPFEIKGNLAHPQVSFAQKTIQQMLKNTAQQEIKKLDPQKINKALEQLKKNGLKGLFGH